MQMEMGPFRGWPPCLAATPHRAKPGLTWTAHETLQVITNHPPNYGKVRYHSCRPGMISHIARYLDVTAMMMDGAAA